MIIYRDGKESDYSIAIWLDVDDLYLSAPETEHQFVDKAAAKIIEEIGADDAT